MRRDSGAGRTRWVGLLALAAATLWSLAITPKVQADEADIVDPLISAGQMSLIFISPTTSGFTFMLIEAWRTVEQAWVDIANSEERMARVGAATAGALLQLDRAVHSSVAGANQLLEKLRSDYRYFEDLRFNDENFRPANRDEERRMRHYRAIRDALKQHEAVVQEAGNGALQAIATVREKAAKQNYQMPSLRTDSPYLTAAIKKLHDAMENLEIDIETLVDEGHTPRNQLRAVFNNEAPNLMFVIHVATAEEGAEPQIRPDTRFGINVYPETPPADQQAIEPKGRRGPSRAWVTVKPGDRIIVRALTLGPVRDRIRFMPIVGRAPRPDLNSFDRGFYYLGYEALLPNNAAPVVSRWQAVREGYEWSLAGGWAPGEQAVNASTGSTTADELKAMGQYAVDVELTNDRLIWPVPVSLESAGQVSGTATVSGFADYVKIGPTSRQRQDLNEPGQGKLSLTMEKW